MTPRRRGPAATAWLALVAALVLLVACGRPEARAPLDAPVTGATAARATPPPGGRTTGRPNVTATVTPTPSPTPSLPERLAANTMAPRDYVALVSAFGGHGEPIPRVVRRTPVPLAEGDARRFWLGDSDTSRTYEITATLAVLSEHTQMWVEEGVEVDREALLASARAFDAHTYPTLRQAFGAEWNPGIDGDPRIVILNARFTGAIGYFFSAHQYSRLANPYSNEAEMVFMNVDALAPGTTAYDAVLAHEFQHMIHWHLDSNEDAWLNEGASELAEVLTGLGSDAGTVAAFAADPDVQLNTWGEEGNVGAHYGASYLMVRYLMERLGADALRDVMESPANGIASIDAVLEARDNGLTFRDLFADWAAANLLDRPDVAGGRWGYRGTDLNASPAERVDVGAMGDGGDGEGTTDTSPDGDEGAVGATGRLPDGDEGAVGATGRSPDGDEDAVGATRRSPDGDEDAVGASVGLPDGDEDAVGATGRSPDGDKDAVGATVGLPDGDEDAVGATGRSPLRGTVAQHATDYIAVAPPPAGGRLRVAFEGQPTVRLVPNAPAGGRWQWWSNRGDASHSSLERILDLTGVSSATLSVDLWYDIEVGWDYAYVRASADGGRTWDALRGAHTSAYNPNGNALAPGYTGVSGADPEGDAGSAEPIWVREEIDLTPYVGGSVLVRFDYVTDDAVNAPGLCLDNLQVEAIGWMDDVEAGEDGWRAVGFVRHDNVLPQDWIVQAIMPGEEPRVERLEVGPDGRGEWLLPPIAEGGEDLILAISALASTTTERAEYALSVIRDRG